uniref:proline-rich receptor-like protein kinase PERK2 n=1 Tax=Oncorhynchus gorbuscha TaxID=8017 RepID=UPI001EAF4365
PTPRPPPAGSQPHVPLLPVPNPTSPPAGSQPHVPSCRFPTPSPPPAGSQPHVHLPVPHPKSTCRFQPHVPLLVPNHTPSPPAAPPAGSKPQLPLLYPRRTQPHQSLLPVPNPKSLCRYSNPKSLLPSTCRFPRSLYPNPTLSLCRYPNPKSCRYTIAGTPHHAPAGSHPTFPASTSPSSPFCRTQPTSLLVPNSRHPAGTTTLPLTLNPLPVPHTTPSAGYPTRPCRFPTPHSPASTPPQVPLPVPNPTSLP